MAVKLKKKTIQYLKADIVAAIVVSLVALPLCMGIALASGAPLFTGLITGVIGGVVVGALSGSSVSVSGPAAGLVAVVISGVNELGSYEAFLLALCFAGLLQVMLGLLRAGFISDYVPSNVIQGLISAIGVLIIIKQLPLAICRHSDFNSLINGLKRAQEQLGFGHFLEFSAYFNISSIMIATTTILIMVYWKKLAFHPFLKTIPAAIVAVVISVLLGIFFDTFWPAFALETTHYVAMPTINSFSTFLENLRGPDFSRLNDKHIYIQAFIIAVVASLETMVSLEAADQLAQKHKRSSRNRELIAQGVGNSLSALTGGLPIASVVVRSSVNIAAGSKTKLSVILHGLLLLGSVLFLSEWLNYIPIPALAAILIYTGYKLCQYAVFKSMYEQGIGYFLPFIATFIGILFTGLLNGVVIGLLVSMILILYNHSKGKFTRVKEKYPTGTVIRYILPQKLSFLNKPAIVRCLEEIPKNSKIIIDASLTEYMEHDISEIIKNFKLFVSKQKNITLNLEGFKARYPELEQVDFINVMGVSAQQTLTPQEVLKILQEGNERFLHRQMIHKNYLQQISATSVSQHPLAVVVSCIDSRVPVEVILDLNIGDVFVVRIAGSVINSDILASIEFACAVSGAKAVVVMSHSNCGAIKAAIDSVSLGHIQGLVEKIRPAILMETEVTEERHSENKTFVNKVAEYNAQLSLKRIYDQSPIMQELVDKEAVGLVQAMYDITTGEVRFSPFFSPPSTVPDECLVSS